MIKKETKVNYDNFANNFIEDIKKDSVYFDIETSGLSPAYNDIVSITYLFFQDDEFLIKQYFSSDELEENEMLICFFNDVKHLKYAISYNGKNFDTNFIDIKFKKYDIPFSLRCLTDIDIYRLVNTFRKRLATDSLKLKNIEELMGIYRNDEITGKDVISLYKAYQLNRKEIFVDFILQHNFEDVVYLPRILDYVLSLYDFKFHTKNYGLVLLKKITFQKQHLRADFFCIEKGIQSTYQQFDSKVSYCTKTENLCISFDIKRYKKEDFRMIYAINSFELEKFKTIAKLKKNIIPLMINERDLHENIYAILSKIIQSSDI